MKDKITISKIVLYDPSYISIKCIENISILFKDYLFIESGREIKHIFKFINIPK